MHRIRDKGLNGKHLEISSDFCYRWNSAHHQEKKQTGRENNLENLTHLLIIWVAVLIAGFIAAKIRLTPVLFFLFFGALLTNAGFLPTEATPFIAGIAEVGIILIMFALGFEESASRFVKSIKKTWGIAFFGGLAPFVVAYSVTYYFWASNAVALLAGLCMTATAVSLTMISLKEEGLGRSRTAIGIMTAAVLDDIASLALVAVLVPIATGSAELTASSLMIVVLEAIAFFALVTALSMWILPAGKDAGLFGKVPILGRHGIQRIFAFENGKRAVLSVLILAVAVGMLAHEMGFHPAVGAYMAGLIVREEYFLMGKGSGKGRHNYTRVKTIIDDVAFTWLGPIFFIVLGGKIVFDVSLYISLIPEIATLLILMIVGQTLSAGLAARYTGGFTWAESGMIGFGMLGRAELAFVVIDIAYVQNNVFSLEVFSVLMAVAFWLNLAVPMAIRFWRPYYDGQKGPAWLTKQQG